MSWSVAAIGKPAAVRAAIADQFAKGGKCAEPEETVRLAAASVMDAALAGQTDPTKAVKASADGSMSQYANLVVTDSLTMSIEPLWGFVE